jgi:serine/threonine protein kinase
LTQVDHPNIVKLFEVFDDDDNYHLVMELMTGGEVMLLKLFLYFFQLFDTIIEKEFYSEKEAAETIRPIIDAIKYCHSLNIIHRDIKVIIKDFLRTSNIARKSFILLKKPCYFNY